MKLRTIKLTSYFDHIDQVKRGLRPRSPRPSGPVVRNGRAASLGGVFAFLLSPWFQLSSSLLCLCKQRSNRTAAKLTHRRLV
ncbi:hypothetical protein NSND_62375 [Nitrospira sp. ND1]|nr:hypothetical protein NSND_62375 [Nitrospira sp. ND1]